MATFGKNTIGASSETIAATTKRFCKFTAPADVGELDAIAAYCDRSASGGGYAVDAAIYTNVGSPGLPDALVANSAIQLSLNIARNSPAWYETAYVTKPVLTPGVTYWLGVLFTKAGITYFDTGEASQEKSRADTLPFDDPFGTTSVTTHAHELSVYATYVPPPEQFNQAVTAVAGATASVVRRAGKLISDAVAAVGSLTPSQVTQATFTPSELSDSGGVIARDASYPPTTVTAVYDADTSDHIDKIRWAADDWQIGVALVRFDTSSLPDNASIVSARLRLNMSGLGGLSPDARQIQVEWYAASNWPISSGDYTSTVANDAHAGTLFDGMEGWQEFELQNLAGISKTGYTGFRLHVSGGQPADTNLVGWFASGETNEPELVVTYQSGGGTEFPQAVTAIVGSASVFSRRAGKAVADSVAGSWALTRQTAKSPSATAGTVSALARAVAKQVSSAAVATSAVLTATRVFLRELLAAAASLPTLSRDVVKTFAASIGSGATLSRVSSFVRALSASVAAPATLLALRTFVRALTASVAASSLLGRQIGKTVSASASAAASLVRRAAKVVSTSAAGVASLVADFVSGGGTQFNQAVTATVGGAFSLARETGKTIASAAALSPSLTRQVAKVLAASALSVASVAKRASQTLSGQVAATPSIVSMRVFLREISAIAGTTALVGLAIAKQVSASVGSAASMLRGLSLSLVLSASVGATGTITRRAAKMLSAVVGIAASLVSRRVFLRELAASVASLATMARVLVWARTLVDTVGSSSSVSRVVGKSVSAGVGAAETVARSVAKTLSSVAGSAASIAKGRFLVLTTAAAATGSITSVFNAITTRTTRRLTTTRPVGGIRSTRPVGGIRSTRPDGGPDTPEAEE